MVKGKGNPELIGLVLYRENSRSERALSMCLEQTRKSMAEVTGFDPASPMSRIYCPETNHCCSASAKSISYIRILRAGSSVVTYRCGYN
jgi:hypothetical protein